MTLFARSFASGASITVFVCFVHYECSTKQTRFRNVALVYRHLEKRIIGVRRVLIEIVRLHTPSFVSPVAACNRFHASTCRSLNDCHGSPHFRQLPFGQP